MCIIIVKRSPTKVIPNDVIIRSIGYNPHGYGITFLDDGATTKTLDEREAIGWLKEKRPFVFHARYATKGKINLDNAHPIRIGESNEFLYQNGTANIPIKRNQSDTTAIAELISTISNGGSSIDNSMVSNILSLNDSRFVITSGKKLKMFNTKLWYKHNKISYSKENVISGNLVFIYGSMRKNNNFDGRLAYYTELCKAKTKEKFDILQIGNTAFLRNNGEYHVNGELYNIDDSKLKSLLTNDLHGYELSKVMVSTELGIDVEATMLNRVNADTLQGKLYEGDSFFSYRRQSKKISSPYDFWKAYNHHYKGTSNPVEIIQDAVQNDINMESFWFKYNNYCFSESTEPLKFIVDDDWKKTWEKAYELHSPL